MLGDLHTHTTFSDGSTDVDMLLKLAKRQGLSHIAVSDHDTALCLEYAFNNPCVNGVSLMPAVELTCFDEKRERRVHMLCYYPKLTQGFTAFFNLMKMRRNEAVGISLGQLEEMYSLFKREDVLKLAKQSEVVYKTHAMRVLLECGYTDGIYKALYGELFGLNGGTVLHEPAYESVNKILELIKEAGGVAVLAHPSVYSSLELVQELASSGRLDGVEINHPRNKPEDMEVLYQIAEKYKLIITGGSDFHGMNMSRPTPLGSFTTNGENIEKIIMLAKKREKA